MPANASPMGRLREYRGRENHFRGRLIDGTSDRHKIDALRAPNIFALIRPWLGQALEAVRFSTPGTPATISGSRAMPRSNRSWSHPGLAGVKIRIQRQMRRPKRAIKQAAFCRVPPRLSYQPAYLPVMATISTTHGTIKIERPSPVLLRNLRSLLPFGACQLAASEDSDINYGIVMQCDQTEVCCVKQEAVECSREDANRWMELQHWICVDALSQFKGEGFSGGYLPAPYLRNATAGSGKRGFPILFFHLPPASNLRSFRSMGLLMTILATGPQSCSKGILRTSNRHSSTLGSPRRSISALTYGRDCTSNPWRCIFSPLART